MNDHLSWRLSLRALLSRYAALAERHTAALLLCLLALALGSIYPISKLELHTDMAELLPDDHPAVVALRRISGRQKSSTNLVLLVESPDAQANRRFAAALRPELEKMIPQVFSEIQWRPETEVPEFARRWRWLYADRADLLQAEALLDRIIALRRQPLLLDLEGDPEGELRTLRQRLTQRLPAAAGGEHFEGEEGGTHYLGVMLWRRGDGLASLGDVQTLQTAEEAVARVRPAAFHPRMKVEYTGNIAMAIDEHNAVRDDLTLATSVCLSLVLLVIFLYFRRVAVLLTIGAPAVLGLLLALWLAQATVHYLNANTAFLISIILGNGINAPIILLARYGEERRGGKGVREALVQAMATTVLATGVAMGAASIAYGSLLSTRFQGLSQFGLVGGAGMLLVWLMTFLLVPPLVLFGERLRPGLLTPRPALLRAPFAWLGGLAARRPGLLMAATLLLVALAVVPTARYLRDPLEWNFGNLRSAETDSQRRWGKMYQLGMGNVGAGYIATDGVLLVDTPAQADPVAEALRRKDRALGARSVLKEVRTLSSMLPAEQQEKLAILGRLRAKIDRHRDLMEDDEQHEAGEWRPPEYLRALRVPDLPRRLRENFTEVDGQLGRLVGIDADPSRFNENDGRELLRMARSLEVEALGKRWVAASHSTLFAAMLEMILRDGPRVTLVALLGVGALLLLCFGPGGAVPVLVALLVGLLWLLSLLWLVKLKVNFVNFVALPITLGVGTDYAANIWARFRLEGPARLRAIVADTGSAVALCSMTTIIGYSSLLLARNRALQSFGLLADLGEVTCLLAALLALPALLQLLFGRGATPAPPPAGTGSCRPASSAGAG